MLVFFYVQINAAKIAAEKHNNGSQTQAEIAKTRTFLHEQVSVLERNIGKKSGKFKTERNARGK